MATGAVCTVRARPVTGEKLSLVGERLILAGTGMKLKDLLPGTGSLEPWSRPDAEITSVVYKSAESAPGSLFVAIRGEKTDGNRFVPEAIARGARAIVSEMIPPPGPEWDALAQGSAAPAVADRVGGARVGPRADAGGAGGPLSQPVARCLLT